MVVRHWHYLHASRAVGWPDQSIALSVVCSAGRIYGERQVRRSTSLLGWAATWWMGSRGEAQDTGQADGITARSFWQWLLARCKRGRTTWIWQLQACAGFNAIDGWQVCRGGIGRLCVVSDPPTILLANANGCGGKTLWLDLRNLSPRITWPDLRLPLPCLGETACHCQAQCTGREIARQRCGALANWLQGWFAVVRDLGLGGLRMTAASQAWHAWKTYFLPCPVEVHTDEQRLSAEHDSVHGGRCECYTLGSAQSSVCEIDASGYYPGLAATHALPGRIARCVGRDRLGAVKAARDGFLVIARGRVRTAAPILPYRYASAERLPNGRCLDQRRVGMGAQSTGTIYPTGTWRATYCWPEWQLLIDSGGDADINTWFGYEPCSPFAGIFRTLREARQRYAGNCQDAYAEVAKLLANSLIGKCAARARYWVNDPTVWRPEEWIEWPHYDEESDAVYRCRQIAGRGQRLVDDGFADEAVPAMASWVYSLGRVQLYKWMEAAGHDNIYYCDTDSLWCNGRGYYRLAQAGAMDRGKLVTLRHIKTHEWFRPLGHKYYETPNGLVCAGLAPPTVDGLAAEGYYWHNERPGAAAWSGHCPTQGLLRLDPYRRGRYTGGTLGADGRIIPHEVQQRDY